MFGNARRAYKRYRWFRKNFELKRNVFVVLWDLYKAERVL